MEKSEKAPEMTFGKALTGFLLPLSIVTVVVLTGNNIGIALLLALFSLFIYGIILGFKWNFLQEALVEGGKLVLVAVVIMLMVGVIIAVWISSGTVPSLLYYGIKLIRPALFLPLAFILCVLTSMATGTSWGTAGTMGVAIMGVAYGMGMPLPLAAGCVVSGAHIGDKLSPMSDTTLLASASTRTNLFDHIVSMLYTTVPISMICLVVYGILGYQYSRTSFDLAQIEIITSGLDGAFKISVFMLIPALLVIALAVCRLPALGVFGIGVVVSIAWAVIFQGRSLPQVFDVAINGFVSNTGVETVDSLLSRGGIVNMMTTVYIALFSGMLSGLLSHMKILSTLMARIRRMVHTSGGIIATVTAVCAVLMLGGGGLYTTMTLPGVAFRETFDELDIHSSVLSRTMEDTGTLIGSIIPWDVSAIFLATALGVPTIQYLPYALLPLLSPLFAIVGGFTGYGIFHRDDRIKYKPFYFRKKDPASAMIKKEDKG